MLLSVRHETSYAYSEPIAYAIQALRLTPRPYDGLTILAWRVRGTSKHELPSFTDGGNAVQRTMGALGAASRIRRRGSSG